MNGWVVVAAVAYGVSTFAACWLLHEAGWRPAPRAAAAYFRERDRATCPPCFDAAVAVSQPHAFSPN